jgi:hypothetical protein
MHPDYPLTRATHQCPLCLRSKAQGLLVCWSCFPLIRDGASAVPTAILDATEDQLVMLHGEDDWNEPYWSPDPGRERFGS